MEGGIEMVKPKIKINGTPEKRVRIAWRAKKLIQKQLRERVREKENIVKKLQLKLSKMKLKIMKPNKDIVYCNFVGL